MKGWEKLSLLSYSHGGDEWTIGWGATFYESKEPVRPGDAISIGRANELLVFHVDLFARQANRCIMSDITQNQFDALLSFNYNTGRLCTSSLLQVVNLNPNDSEIPELFLRYVYRKGKVWPGLINRRLGEIHLYQTGELKFDFDKKLIQQYVDKIKASR